MTIKKATRQGVKPLIGFYGESGCGKTYSSLLLARGLVGPSGKIAMVDSEGGRGSLYADVIPGGYDVLQLDSPFTPARYIESIETVEKSGYSVIVTDSASHEWEGVGGVLDMAAACEEKSAKPGLHNWKMPKMEHNKFMRRLLQCSIPVVVCLRAKHKTRQVKENGRTVIVKDDFTTPIQADDFIFEMTAHAEIMQDHSIHLTKCSHPTLRDVFPAKGPITIQTGEALAKWCAAPGVSGTIPIKEKMQSVWETANVKKQLWELTKSKHGGDLNAFRQWLVDEMLLDPDTPLDEVTATQWQSILNLARKKLA